MFIILFNHHLPIVFDIGLQYQKGNSFAADNKSDYIDLFSVFIARLSGQFLDDV